MNMRKRSYPVSLAALRIFIFAALLCLSLPLWAYASDTPEVTIDSITAAPDYSKYKSPIAQICAKVSPVTDASGSFSAEVYINGAKANSLDCAWLDNLNTYDADSSTATIYLRVPVDQGLHNYLRGASASLSKDYTFSVRLQYYDQDEDSSPEQKECLSNPYTIDKYSAPAAPQPVIKKIAKYSSSSTTLAYVYVDNCTAGTVYMDDVKRSTCTYVSSQKAFKVNVPAELGKYLAGKTKVLPNAHVFRVVSNKGVKSANKTVAATVAKPVISKVTKYSSTSNTYAYVYCSNCTKEAKVYLNGTKKTATYESSKKRFKVSVPTALGQYLNGSSQFLAKDYSFKVINKAGSISALKTIAAKPDVPTISNIGKDKDTYVYVYVSNFSKTYGFKCEIDSGSGWKSATSSYISSKRALEVKVGSDVGKYLKGTNKYIDKDYKFRVTCYDKNKKSKVSDVYTVKRNSAPPSITAVSGQIIEERVIQGNEDLGYRIASVAKVYVKSAYTNYTVWLNGVQLSKASNVANNAYHVPYELAKYLQGRSSQLSQDYKFVVKNPDGKSSAANVIKASYPSGALQIAQVSTEGDCWIKLHVTNCPSGTVLIDGRETVSFSIPAEEGGYYIYVYDENEITWVANGWRGKLSKSHTVQVTRGDKKKTFLNLNSGMTRNDFVDTDLTAISSPSPSPSSSPTPTPTPSVSPNVFAGGNGTADNPFIIKTAAQLDKVRDYFPINNYFGCCFKLANDIDLTNYNFTPIETFNGNFDGNNHTITLDYHISEWDINQYYYVGLFGNVYNTSNSIIKNLTVDGIVEVHDIDKKSLACGAIVGHYYGGDNEIYLINCHNKATIKYTSTGIEEANIGGLMGWGRYVNMVNCTNEGDIEVQCNSAETEVGGLCGDPNNLKMYNCKNKADLTYSGGGNVYIAGLASGTASLGYTEVSDNCNSGNITVETEQQWQRVSISGLYNNLWRSTVNRCYNTGTITAPNSRTTYLIGGVIGNASDSNISSCYNAGILTAPNSKASIGGVIGDAYDSNISDCYNTGTLSAPNSENAKIGGVIYYPSRCIINNCYNQADITLTAYGTIGGISLWTSESSIISCHNTGNLQIIDTTAQPLSSTICGICLLRDFDITIANCYNTGRLEYQANDNSNDDGSISIAGITDRCYGDRNKHTINNCYNTGDINVTSNKKDVDISGIIISIGSHDSISSCFNSGDIYHYSTSTDFNHQAIAGIVDYNNDEGFSISSCYNTGNIISENGTCSGIVGAVHLHPLDSINNCINSGNILGRYSYGLVGHIYNDSGTFINNCYYMQTDSINPGVAACDNINAIGENVSALSEAQFRGLLSVGDDDKMLYELLGDLFCRNTAQDNVLGKGILNGFPILRWQTEEQ